MSSRKAPKKETEQTELAPLDDPASTSPSSSDPPEAWQRSVELVPLSKLAPPLFLTIMRVCGCNTDGTINRTRLYAVSVLQGLFTVGTFIREFGNVDYAAIFFFCAIVPELFFQVSRLHVHGAGTRLMVATYDQEASRQQFAEIARGSTAVMAAFFVLFLTGIAYWDGTRLWSLDKAWGFPMVPTVIVGGIAHLFVNTIGFFASAGFILFHCESYCDALITFGVRLQRAHVDLHTLVDEAALLEEAHLELRAFERYNQMLTFNAVFTCTICFYANLFTFGGTSVLLWMLALSKALLLVPTLHRMSTTNFDWDVATERVALRHPVLTVSERADLINVLRTANLYIRAGSVPVRHGGILRVMYISLTIFLTLVRLSTTAEGRALFGVPRLLDA